MKRFFLIPFFLFLLAFGVSAQTASNLELKSANGYDVMINGTMVFEWYNVSSNAIWIVNVSGTGKISNLGSGNAIVSFYNMTDPNDDIRYNTGAVTENIVDSEITVPVGGFIEIGHFVADVQEATSIGGGGGGGGSSSSYVPSGGVNVSVVIGDLVVLADSEWVRGLKSLVKISVYNESDGFVTPDEIFVGFDDPECFNEIKRTNPSEGLFEVSILPTESCVLGDYNLIVTAKAFNTKRVDKPVKIVLKKVEAVKDSVVSFISGDSFGKWAMLIVGSLVFALIVVLLLFSVSLKASKKS